MIPSFRLQKLSWAKRATFENSGLNRKHWKSAAAIRDIFRQEFNRVDLPYYNPA